MPTKDIVFLALMPGEAELVAALLADCANNTPLAASLLARLERITYVA